MSEEMKYDLKESDRHIFVFDSRHISHPSQISTVYTFMWFNYKTNFELRNILLPPLLNYYSDLNLFWVNYPVSWIIDKVLQRNRRRKYDLDKEKSNINLTSAYIFEYDINRMRTLVHKYSFLMQSSKDDMDLKFCFNLQNNSILPPLLEEPSPIATYLGLEEISIRKEAITINISPIKRKCGIQILF